MALGSFVFVIAMADSLIGVFHRHDPRQRAADAEPVRSE
jgi:hypothetical protein